MEGKVIKELLKQECFLIFLLIIFKIKVGLPNWLYMTRIPELLGAEAGGSLQV